MTVHAAPRLLIAEPAIPGLLWGVRFDGDGRPEVLPEDEDPLDIGMPGEGFVWLHFNLVDARLDGLIRAGRLGPPNLAGAIFSRDDHQRVIVEGAFIAGVTADLSYDFAAHSGPEPVPPEAITPDRIGRLHFVLGPRFLISGRRRAVAGVEATRQTVGGGAPMVSPPALLEALVSHAVGPMVALAAKLVDDLDGIEDHVLDARYRDDAKRLGPIRRDAVRLHRQLIGLSAVFHRLEERCADGGLEGGLPKTTLVTAARLAQRLDSLDRDMMAVADRTRLLQDEIAAKIAAETNRHLYVLSILSAVFLPATFITGLFGINTKGLWFGESEWGSHGVLLLCIAAAAATFLLIWQLRVAGRRE